MADFTTVAIFPTRGENSHYPVSKQTVKVQLLLNLLGKTTCFTRGEQAIVNSCEIRLVSFLFIILSVRYLNKIDHVTLLIYALKFNAEVQ